MAFKLLFTYTTPNHPWRKEYPEFYKSSQAKNDTSFNQDYIRFNLEHKTLQKKLIHILEHWMKDFPLDGLNDLYHIKMKDVINIIWTTRQQNT